jgi:hypothetical protein
VLDDSIGRYRAEFGDVPFGREAGEGVEASCGSEVRRDRVLENLDLELALDRLPAHTRHRMQSPARETNGMIWNRFNFSVISRPQAHQRLRFHCSRILVTARSHRTGLAQARL